MCFWEDDYVQGIDPDAEGGANGVSLALARMNFLAFDASEERFLDDVRSARMGESSSPIEELAELRPLSEDE